MQQEQAMQQQASTAQMGPGGMAGRAVGGSLGSQLTPEMMRWLRMMQMYQTNAPGGQTPKRLVEDGQGPDFGDVLGYSPSAGGGGQ